MMRRICIIAVFFCLAISLRADPGPLSIWFTNSVTLGDPVHWYNWALPIGNGKLAAMIYGGVGLENIQFNEDTIWSGQPHYTENTNSTPARLASARTDCFNGTDILTEFTDNEMSLPPREASYQDAGSLVLSFPHSGLVNYRRSLDLNTATVHVHYDFSGVTYNRDIFASAPSNRVIAVHFTASQPGRITFNCTFSTQQKGTLSTVNTDLVLHALVFGQSDYRYVAYGLTNAVRYDARVRLIANGGVVTVGSNFLAVTNADDATLLLSVASNVKNYHDLTADYVTICSNSVDAAAQLAYSELHQAQLTDYTNLFNRVTLDLGCNPARTNADIGYRKKQISIDGNDPQFVTLDFQLGRYLMIAGSRPGSQALNLQGKWNCLTNLSQQWDSKMTLNINEEMNYWGAEVCNLSECTLPLFDLMRDLTETGHRAAGTNYFCDGWVAHHNTDLWRDASAVNATDGIWPTGAAWLCQHVWWHYLYTGDTNWLATNGYPMMKGAAQFFQGFLIHPTTPGFLNLNTNWLVTCPSYSPEHGIKIPGSSSEVPNVPGPTMDNELCRDLFSHVIAASQLLGIDESFRTNIAALQSQLPPDRVSTNGTGCLLEWLYDVDYDSGHRHCSQLVGFFPGDQISTFYTPTIAAAAKVSVDERGYANGNLTPWSCAWRLNLRTRLQDGDDAYTNLVFLYGYNKVSTNLIFADTHMQLDSIYGRLSGIAEMFLQSESGEVFLLPALPSRFTNGTVSGLCARGGFEVDNLSWTNGKLTGATLLSKVGNVCRLRSKWPIDVMLGSNYVDAPMVLPGLYQFSTTAGSNYTIVPSTVFETESLTATTSGDPHLIRTNAAYSGWRGTQLSANAPGDFVTYTLSNVVAGTYEVFTVADASTNTAQFQLSCGPTNIGAVQETYCTTNVAYLLPSHLLWTKVTTSTTTNFYLGPTSTNVIQLWTNMLKEFDCGTWTAPSNGNYNVTFTIAGKNAGSSGYTLALDYLRLKPVNNATVVLAPLEQWRLTEFGNDSTNPAIAGDTADPDGDGLQNIAEYALGRDPKTFDTMPLYSITNEAGYFSLVYQRAIAATDVTFIVEVKDDLTGTWTTSVQMPEISDDGNGVTETVRVRDTVLMDGTPHRFMRLRITKP